MIAETLIFSLNPTNAWVHRSSRCFPQGVIAAAAVVRDNCGDRRAAAAVGLGAKKDRW